MVYKEIKKQVDLDDPNIFTDFVLKAQSSDSSPSKGSKSCKQVYFCLITLVANNLSHFKFAKLKKHITVSKSPIKNEGLWDKYKK